ncbi:MAG: hypothetical protein IJD64_00800 [Clostridia bacterium]|nr:hypothetical protein [Clostridia bacterium]
MMKKLIALGMCLLMVLSVCLTGCSEKTNEEAVADISEKASKSAMTLSLYLMSDMKVEKCDNCEKVDAGEDGAKTCVDLDTQPCTYRLISNAVNRITESKFKTRLVLHYYTEAEYYQKLEESFAKREAAKKAGLLGNTEISEETSEDETFVNELGQVEIKYPTIAGYQVDIFYFGGEEKFKQYKEGGLLSELDSQLSDASKKLTQYIFPQFLSGIKTLGGGTTYAIPTNRPVGEYTYLLVNKQAMRDLDRKFDLSYARLAEVGAQSFLADIERSMSDTYYPIYLSDGISVADAATLGVNFFGVDVNGNFSNKFSLMGGYFESGKDSFANALQGGKILNNAMFTEQLRVLKDYESKGYFYNAAEDANKKFAMAYIKGDATTVEQYSDEYDIFTLETPIVREADLYEHMMGVSSTTTSVSRSMQILTLLNTDEEFRNLILYGIEGEHYRVEDTHVAKNEDGDTYMKVVRLSNSYVMDENKTGNVFIAYPLQPTGAGAAQIIPSIRDYGIKHNQTLSLDVALGFEINKDFTIDMEAMQLIREASEHVWAKYAECETYEEFYNYCFVDLTGTDAQGKEYIIKKAYLNEDAIKTALANMISYNHGYNGAEPKLCEEICGSFGCAFAKWGIGSGIIEVKS